jgi:hypothetical protein
LTQFSASVPSLGWHNGSSAYPFGGIADAGETGFSNLDSDGSETLINYNGFSIPTTILVGSLALPTTITFTGSATVSVPEVSSALLVGASLSGLSMFIARKRKV